LGFLAFCGHVVFPVQEVCVPLRGSYMLRTTRSRLR
jgi:hypothetical protein